MFQKSLVHFPDILSKILFSIILNNNEPCMEVGLILTNLQGG